MRSIFWKITRYLGLAVSFLIIIVALFVLHRCTVLADPQGDESDCCGTEKLPAVPNGAGLVVTAHTTGCDCAFVHDTGNYIYVHPVAKSDSRRSLVFRYSDSEVPRIKPGETNGSAPKITWIGPTALNIAVDHIGEISKQLDSMQGVKISYTIGTQDYPPANGMPPSVFYVFFVSMSLLLIAIASMTFILWSLRTERQKTGNSSTI